MTPDKAIEKMQTRGDLEGLIQTLGDENWPTRIAAANALGEIGDAEAVGPLIEALGDEDAWVRWSAAEALGKVRDKRAVKPLIDTLRDATWGVRKSAAEALEEMGDKEAVKAVSALREAGFHDEARKLKFKELARAYETTREVTRKLAELADMKRRGLACEIELAELERHALRLEEARLVAEDVGDVKILNDVNALVDFISQLKPSTRITIKDSVVNRSNLGGSRGATTPEAEEFHKLMGELRELVNWKKQGLLSSAEYKKAKKRLLELRFSL